MASRAAWVLNLDADLELGASRRYEPTQRVRVAMQAHGERLARSLLGPDDIVVDASSKEGSALGFSGRAFCPTPRAIGILRRVGAEIEPHPGVDVLRQVNSRAFASSLGQTLPGALFATTVEDALGLLHSEPEAGTAWRLKHPLGMSGRNQRVVSPSKVEEADRRFIVNGLGQGGVQIEPNVAVEIEYGLHGFLDEDGGLRLGHLVRQRCNARGAWLSTEALTGLDVGDGSLVETLTDEARRVAEALYAAGYFGPFGVDSFSYRDRAGEIRLQPRSEINARYSMGFAVGMGMDRRVDGQEVAESWPTGRARLSSA